MPTQFILLLSSGFLKLSGGKNKTSEKVFSKVDLEHYTVTDEMGNKIRLGDPIKVVVRSVDLEKKQIDFSLF